MNPSSSTAILFFTRTPEEEARQKTFVKANRHVNQRIARQLIKHTFSRLRKAGIPVYVVNSDQQRGSTFGDRLAAAFKDIFDFGYSNVIAVGNDTLTLTPEDIQTATNLLQKNRAVIGPTHNGGTYLIGLHCSVFSRLDFAALPWENKELLENLLEAINSRVHLLKYQRDVNTETEFLTALSELSEHSSLLKDLQAILFKVVFLALPDRPRIPVKATLKSYSHRAPPCLSYTLLS